MAEYKFSNSNLDFNELLDKYKTLNTTYSDTVDIKINIYENCNLLQDLITTFTVLSTNIRLSSFKNNYIIADTQTLDLDQTFYTNNNGLFTTVAQDGTTYINNINLTNIIKTHFNYANDDIYPSKKIIIKINLLNNIVDTDGSGALQINMQEITAHFHSLFDTLEVDINQYVTGKHGELEATNRLPPNSNKGGSGQNGLDGGPAINIINNDPSYFKLNIITNGKVSGGFGASGGDGGAGKTNESPFVITRTTGDSVQAEYYSSLNLANPFNSGRFVSVSSELETEYTGLMPATYYWKNTTNYWYDGLIKSISMDNTIIGTFLDYSQNSTPPTLSPAIFPEIVLTTEQYKKTTYQYAAGTAVADANNLWKIRILNHVYEKTPEIASTFGSTGSTANYSNNVDNQFPSSNGNIGTANDGQGGAGGTKGNPGGIINITATNIYTIDS